MSFFKPDDFAEGNVPSAPDIWAAKQANALLQERGVRVLSHQGPSTNGPETPVWIAKPWQDADSTHQALLVCIEDLPKKECQHEPREVVFGVSNDAIYDVTTGKWHSVPICRNCGVKLKKKWEVAE